MSGLLARAALRGLLFLRVSNSSSTLFQILPTWALRIASKPEVSMDRCISILLTHAFFSLCRPILESADWPLREDDRIPQIATSFDASRHINTPACRTTALRRGNGIIVFPLATGFIGSNIVEALNERGRDELVVCDWLREDLRSQDLRKRTFRDLFL